jgi:hypothetical protein
MRKGSSFLVAVAVAVPLAVAIAVLLWFFSSPGHLTRGEATSDLVSFATQTLELSAVTGFAAMSTLEMLKRLLHLRGRFFLREIPRLAGRALVLGLVSPTWEDHLHEGPWEKDVAEDPGDMRAGSTCRSNNLSRNLATWLTRRSTESRLAVNRATMISCLVSSDFRAITRPPGRLTVLRAKGKI